MVRNKHNRISKLQYAIAGTSFLIVALCCAYVYLLSATVVHVVMHKELRAQMNEVNSQIATLETEYIARQHAVSAEIATLDGFVATEHKVFIDRTPTSLVLGRSGL